MPLVVLPRVLYLRRLVHFYSPSVCESIILRVPAKEDAAHCEHLAARRSLRDRLQGSAKPGSVCHGDEAVVSVAPVGSGDHVEPLRGPLQRWEPVVGSLGGDRCLCAGGARYT